MKTPRRRLFSTSNCLIVLYCLVTILYFGWAIIPVRARPLLAGTVPTVPTKTPKPTKTPTLVPGATATATDLATATASPAPTNADPATETPTLLPGVTPTATAIATASPAPTNVDPATTATASPTPTNTDAQAATSTPIATANATLTPTPTVANAVVVLTKAAFLFNDMDQNNLVSPGDKLLYAITLINTGKVPAQQLRLADTLDPNITLVSGTLKTDRGRASQGNNAGYTQVIIEIGTLAPGERATISLQVSINPQINDTQVQNQAIATFAHEVNGLSGQITVMSDDPATTQLSDVTITPLNGNQPRPSRKLFLPFVAQQK